jgi:transcriptional regulator with XRE-family HTH domain
MNKPAPPTGLRAVRLAKGWPIGLLAEEADMAISTIRRAETGLTEPSQKTRRALAKALGVSQADLFGTGK